MAEKLYKIPNVEIFSVGKWNGNEITEETLDHIVEAYYKTNSVIPVGIKLGHPEKQTILDNEQLPAAGWVENVRKVGGKLVADFVDIPKKIFKIIKQKGYRKVSVEIYNNVEIGEEKYPKLLGAVALLGAQIPGVMNLADILSNYKFSEVQNFGSDVDLAIITNDLQLEEDDPMPTVEELQAELAAKNAELANANKAKDEYKLKADQAEAEKAEAVKALLESQRKEKEAQVDKFCTELVSEKLISKAGAEYVKAMLLDEKEKYSIGEDKDLSKPDVLKKVLKFAKEASKVNFDDKTGETGKTTGRLSQKELNAKIEKYALDNKVTHSQAYKAVLKELGVTEYVEGAESEGDDE